MKDEGRFSENFLSKRKRGMALPFTLIVLLVAGAMVGVSLYLIESMATTTKMKTDDELRMNAALTGIERSKQWIVHSITVDNHIPRRNDSDKLVTSSDMGGALTSDPKFDFLVPRDKSGNMGVLSGTVDGVPYKTVLYDLSYRAADSVSFITEMPPEMRYLWNDAALEGMSAVQGQNYASSNRGGSHGGAGSLEVEYGFYLARSTSVLNGIEKVIEQGLRMRE